MQALWLSSDKKKRQPHFLGKETPAGRTGTVVPDNDELRIGTLKGLLEMANIVEEEFAEYQ